MVDMQKAADEQKMHIAEALKKVKAEVVILENEMKEYRSLRKRVTSQTVTSQTSFVTSQTHPSRFANVFELFLKRLI